MWNKTLREQHEIRQELMCGLGNLEMREALWEKHYWKGADEERVQKLTFDEVERLCRGLNINSSREDLERLFTVRHTVVVSFRSYP
jgi:phosphatidylinositol phospholipase C delta